LQAANALDLIRRYDIVADGSDNFSTRYLVSDVCFFAKRPLVTAAVGIFDGTLTTIRAHERNPDGKPNPSYRCLFPEPPPAGTVPICAEAGIRSDPGNRRLWRGPGRTVVDAGRTLHALRDANL
jgi:adenylyltransferase/sulfurtransferase